MVAGCSGTASGAQSTWRGQSSAGGGGGRVVRRKQAKHIAVAALRLQASGTVAAGGHHTFSKLWFLLLPKFINCSCELYRALTGPWRAQERALRTRAAATRLDVRKDIAPCPTAEVREDGGKTLGASASAHQPH